MSVFEFLLAFGVIAVVVIGVFFNLSLIASEYGLSIRRWLFRAYLGWRRAWVDAQHAKVRRDEARTRLERWKREHSG